MSSLCSRRTPPSVQACVTRNCRQAHRPRPKLLSERYRRTAPKYEFERKPFECPWADYVRRQFASGQRSTRSMVSPSRLGAGEGRVQPLRQGPVGDVDHSMDAVPDLSPALVVLTSAVSLSGARPFRISMNRAPKSKPDVASSSTTFSPPSEPGHRSVWPFSVSTRRFGDWRS